MARPIKNYCDYFPHDRDMRNHKKIKAIRNKYPNGYAIWVMTLEHLTGSDGNVFPYTDLEFELMSGDFGFSVAEIRGVIDYCINLELLFLRNGFVNSDSLDERLAPVYEKRDKAKDISAQQKRNNGKFTANNTEQTDVSVTEMPQSKVNEIKVNETKLKKNKPKINDADKSATLEERQKTFMLKVAEFKNEYTKEMLRAFYNYWTEMNEGGKKMRFEAQKFFDISKRLNTWSNNEKKGYGKQGLTAQGTLDRLNSYTND